MKLGKRKRPKKKGAKWKVGERAGKNYLRTAVCSTQSFMIDGDRHVGTSVVLNRRRHGDGAADDEPADLLDDGGGNGERAGEAEGKGEPGRRNAIPRASALDSPAFRFRVQRLTSFRFVGRKRGVGKGKGKGKGKRPTYSSSGLPTMPPGQWFSPRRPAPLGLRSPTRARARTRSRSVNWTRTSSVVSGGEDVIVREREGERERERERKKERERAGGKRQRERTAGRKKEKQREEVEVRPAHSTVVEWVDWDESGGENVIVMRVMVKMRYVICDCCRC